MRIQPHGTYETFKALADDPLPRYRRIAQQALDQPERDFSHTEFGAAEGFDADVARAFATVARFLDSTESDNTVDRDSALNFLTGPEPLVDTEEGQVVRLHRGTDGRVRAVTVMRSDDDTVTSIDMRFPFRLVKDFDAEYRISRKWVAEFNIEWSVVPGVKERARDDLRQLPGMVGDDKYQRAAALYLQAKEAGFSSTRHLIETEMDVSYNYAGVLISRARDKGYLPPVTKTTKGNT